jgi:hypothetical protein
MKGPKGTGAIAELERAFEMPELSWAAAEDVANGASAVARLATEQLMSLTRRPSPN